MIDEDRLLPSTEVAGDPDKQSGEVADGENATSWKDHDEARQVKKSVEPVGRVGLAGLFSKSLLRSGKATLGIDIGTQSVKMILLKRKGKTIESLSTRIVKRPAADLGEKGQIEDVIPLIKDAVKDFREGVNNVVISVQGPAVMIRRLGVPPMPKSELKLAIPWVIGKFLRYPVRDAVFDYQILGERKGSAELELVVVVARKEWIIRLMAQFKKIGLPPSVVTISPFALGNLMRYLEGDKDTYDVVINIGERVTSISFYSANRLEFSRDIMTAGDAITSSLTGKVTYKGEEFTIGPEMAEEIKCRYGIPIGETPEFSDKGIPVASIQALIRPAVERLATEIDRSIKYANRTYQIENIGRILLTGGSANLTNLSEYLETALGHPVEKFNPAIKIDAIEQFLDEDSHAIFDKLGLSLSVALGLAIDRGDGLNLVLKGVQDIKRATLEKKLLRIAAGLLLLVLTGTSVNLEIKRRIDERKFMIANDMWNSIKNDPSFDDVNTIRARVRKVEQLLERFTLNRDFTSLLLKDISHRVPEGVVLEDLMLTRKRVTSENGRETLPGEATEDVAKSWVLGLEGIITYPTALSEPILTEIMLDLGNSPFLKNPRIVNLEKIDEYGEEAMEFYITCDVIRSVADDMGYL